MEMKWLVYIGVLLTGCTPALVKDIAYETAEEIECGYLPFELLCDFTLMDQHGNDWSLYDHKGKITVLDLSAMWCAPCRNAALASQNVVNSFGHDKVQWVTILVEDVERNPPDLADLQSWELAYGNGSEPILAGDRSLLDASGQNGFPLTSWPTFLILDEDLKIVEILKGWNEQTLKLAIEQILIN
tara:strand:+ start:66 stop:623 length:558 start_codon:yes stop_codon:yes gene_type:complete